MGFTHLCHSLSVLSHCAHILFQLHEERVDREAGEQALLLSRMLTLQDPFQGFPFTTTPGGAGIRQAVCMCVCVRPLSVSACICICLDKGRCVLQHAQLGSRAIEVTVCPVLQLCTHHADHARHGEPSCWSASALLHHALEGMLVTSQLNWQFTCRFCVLFALQKGIMVHLRILGPPNILK